MPTHFPTGTYKIKLQRPVALFCMYDSKGEIFHQRDLPKNENELYVNIPRADYYKTNVPCIIAGHSDLYITGGLIQLPAPERQRMKDVRIVYNSSLQGTPARINTYGNPAIIEVGKRFFSFPRQTRFFILCHELGHMFYETEWKVDLFALMVFLQRGYNASQAFYALSKTLKDSPQNKDRINRLFYSIKENQNNYGSLKR